MFNSDLEEFGGSGVKNEGELLTQEVAWHNRGQSIEVRIPPLATIYLKYVKGSYVEPEKETTKE